MNTSQTLLQINTSLFAGAGNSSQLSDRFVAAWRERHPDGRVVVRDLSSGAVPHLTAEHVVAFSTPAEQRSPQQAALVAASDALIAELKAADVLVLGLPLYNFGVPSTLKAYFDQIARAGVSFRYTASGPEGLLGDRKVFVLAARGGYYQGTPADTQTSYVTTFLNFLGMKDIEFVYAEGLNINPDAKAKALNQANAQIERLAA